MAVPASAQDSALFRRLSGGWGGTGSVQLPTGTERIRCRGSYSGGGEQLRVNLLCASDSFKVQIALGLARQGDRVSGTWSEAGSGFGGGVSGSVRGDRVDTAFSGPASGSLSMVLRGNTQQLTLVSQSAIAGSASVALHRL